MLNRNLNPTLWRTCKMLAGATRIRLIRQLYAHPGECVSVLGQRAGIGESAASQELRRIQSRGLLQSDRQGTYLVYRMASDPQVSSAAPILKAIQCALRDWGPERDLEMAVLASGLSHERRIRMFRELLSAPRRLLDLQISLHIPSHPIHEHLRTLLASGFAVRSEKQVHAAVPNHPLAKALAKLIQQGTAR